MATVRLNNQQKDEIIYLYEINSFIAPGNLMKRVTITAMLDILGWDIIHVSGEGYQLRKQK